MNSGRRITFALVGLIVLVLAGWLVKEAVGKPSGDSAPSSSVSAGELPGATSGLPVKALSALPREAADTWKLIQQGGPFPYDRDGVPFENREKRLPGKDKGYYKEYTVKTPGGKDRGERRLIFGDRRELYYTGDHYESFVVVDPRR